MGIGRQRWTPELIVATIGAAALIALAPVNTDSGWYLIGARRLLAGERLYVDLADVNPPLIFWLLSLPAWFGQVVFSASDARLIGGFTAIVLLISVGLVLHVMRVSPVTPRSLQISIVAGLLIPSIPLYAFQAGQREQLATFLLLPYLVLAARTVAGSHASVRLRIAVGLAAGVGLALKPFFLAPWLAAELTVVVLSRTLRPSVRLESLVVAAIQALYVTLILVFVPEYVTDVVPLARATYHAYGGDWRTLLPLSWTYGLALVAVIGGAMPLLFPGAHAPYAAIFGAATVGFVASYVAQAKGFTYHLMPAQVYGGLTLFVIGEGVARAALRFRQQRLRTRATVLALAAFLLVAGYEALPLARMVSSAFYNSMVNPYGAATERMVKLVEEYSVGEPFYMLSTSTWPAFPITNLAAARWPYHYNCLWPIPALYAEGEIRYRSPDDQSPLEREFFDTVVQDLLEHPPRLLAVDRRQQMQAMRGRHFDYVKYFSASPEFAALFGKYRRLGQIVEWEFYERTY